MRLLNGFLVSFFCCIAVWQPFYTSAQVRLPQLVSDGMVLQQDTKLNIWGWASPGEKIKVSFNKKIYKTVTGSNGKWFVIISPLKAGGPYSMEISASNHITLNNIAVGDVWFCSGQSNMVIPMERVKEKYPEEIANANYPLIRSFFVPTVSDVSKIHDDLSPGKWIAADPKTVLGFSAVSYFFAKHIYNKYHVPIGIINSSVGGTPIQAWISADGFKQFPNYIARLAQLKDTTWLKKQTTPTVQTNIGKDPAEELDKGLNEPKPWFDTTYIPIMWHKYWLPGYWADQGIRSLNGVVWFRKEINLPASATGQPGKLFMGRIVDADYVYVNGVLCGHITYQYPPRRYLIPAGVLKPGKNLVVVRVINTVGKGGFVPDKPYYIKVGDLITDLRGDWQYKVGVAFRPVPKDNIGSAFSAQKEPTGLYNTMVAPVTNYSVKGILWDQGEDNTYNSKEYRQLLPALIKDWREKWHQANLPFLYSQLPNFMETQYLPSESNWAELRDAQLSALSVLNTAMAVAIDVGEWNDVHPLNKKAVGDRLALGAEKIAYGDEGIVASGPIYQSAKIDNGKIEITFTSAGSGLVANDGNELDQFAIAGADKKYVWAKAIIKNNKVIVYSDEVPDPKYVRYAWADNPDGANLYNIEGLPASPFTTDDTP